jgi:hypothetical protein
MQVAAARHGRLTEARGDLIARPSGQERTGELVRRQRLAEIKALAFLAAECLQQRGGRAVLDAFNDHCELQFLAQADGRFDDRRIIGIAHQTDDERSIDLEPVNREVLQKGEARITGAE